MASSSSNGDVGRDAWLDPPAREPAMEEETDDDSEILPLPLKLDSLASGENSAEEESELFRLNDASMGAGP